MHDQKVPVLDLKDTQFMHTQPMAHDNEPFPITQPEQQETVKHTAFLIRCLSAHLLCVCLTLTQQKSLLLNMTKCKSTAGWQGWAVYHRSIIKRQRNTIPTHIDTYKGRTAVNKQTWPLGKPSFCWKFGVQRVWQHTVFFLWAGKTGEMLFGQHVLWSSDNTNLNVLWDSHNKSLSK